MNPRYTVTLEAQPTPVPAEVRLRQLLKIGLRGFKLRALSVGPAPELPAAPPPVTPPPATPAPTPPAPAEPGDWWDIEIEGPFTDATNGDQRQ